jgi:hypothetical protein
MALYSQLLLNMDGQPLAENTTLESALEADIQDVFTIRRNWAGITPAPIVRSMTATNVIPLPGVEYDFEEKMLLTIEVAMQLQEAGSGKTCVSDGYIVNVPRSAGVGQTTTINCSYRGTPSKFE